MVFKDPAGSKQAQIQLAAQEKQILQSLALLKNKDYKAPPTPVIPTYQNDVSNYTTPMHKLHCLKKLLETEYENDLCLGHPSCFVYCECKEKAKAFEDSIAQYINKVFSKNVPSDKPNQAPITIASCFSDDNAMAFSDDDEEESTLPQVNINII